METVLNPNENFLRLKRLASQAQDMKLYNFLSSTHTLTQTGWNGIVETRGVVNKYLENY